MMKRYAVNSKAVAADLPILIDTLNEQSIEDTETIRNQVVEKNIAVGDLQFLIDDDGQVYIADPTSAMSRSIADRHVTQLMNRRIEQLLAHARLAIDIRDGASEPTEITRYRSSNDPKVQRWISSQRPP